MPIGSSPVQQASGSATSGSSVPITISAPTAGNNLYVMIEIRPFTTTVSSISGGGVTWTKAGSVASSGFPDAEIWQGPNSSGSGTSITINTSGTITAAYAVCAEWNGLDSGGALDSAASNPASNFNSSSTPSATPGITTANAADLILIVYGCVTARTVSSGPTASFTGFTSPAATLMNCAYRVVSATGTYNPQWNLSGSSAWSCVSVAFKGAVTSAFIADDPDIIPQAVARSSYF
jgi:hypothetical protein